MKKRSKIYLNIIIRAVIRIYNKHSKHYNGPNLKGQCLMLSNHLLIILFKTANNYEVLNFKAEKQIINLMKSYQIYQIFKIKKTSK